ncbi:MAG: glycosyltransferase 87 family protein [Candidatus Limnocylindrales bacterium]
MNRLAQRARVQWNWLLPVAAISYLVVVNAPDRVLGVPYPLALAAPLLGLGLGRWLTTARPFRLADLAALAVVVIGLAALLAWDVSLTQALTSRTVLLRTAVMGGGALLLGIAQGSWQRRRPTALEALATVALVGMALFDLRLVSSEFLRDLHLYLRAGADFLAGRQFYTLEPLTASPADPTALPYLYPPFTIPFFAALSLLPRAVVDTVWALGASVVVVLGLRRFGLNWSWVPLIFLWPPFVQGIWVGNVDIFTFGFFALAPWAPVLLGLVPIFKVQAGIVSLWLPREGQWAAVIASIGFVVLLVVVTLPLVGLSAWSDWVQALLAFSQTAQRFTSVQGQALDRFVGAPIILVVTLAAVAAGLWLRGRASLAALGLASLPASPTLYIHGFSIAMPAILRLRALPLWIGMTFMASPRNQGTWWVFLLVAGLAPFVRAVRRAPGDPSDAPHPLAAEPMPWPAAPARFR